MKNLLFFCILFFSNVAISQTLETAGSLHTLRCDQESQLLNNGKVITFGGNDGYLQPKIYRSAEIYDRSTNTWSYADSMLEKRNEFTSVMLNDGRILAIGGSNTVSPHLASCEWYDPSTGKWGLAPSLNTPRSQHKALVIDNGKVLVLGGDDNSCELFDPIKNKWVYTAPMLYRHGFGLSAITLANGNVFVCGGQANPNQAEIYDPVTSKWTATGLLNYRRENSSLVLLNDGKVLIYGSSDISVNGGYLTPEVFDSVTGSFDLTFDLNVARANSPGILLDDGRVLTYGIGNVLNGTDTKVIEIYDPINKKWTADTYNFIGGVAYTIHKLFTGELLIVGGTSTTGNGANATCLLIKPTETAGCIPPVSSLIVKASTPVICYGNDGTITILNSETGVNYKAMINTTSMGSAVSGGGKIDLHIPFKGLTIGNNVISVIASKEHCNGIVLNDTAHLIVQRTNLAKPKIIADGPLLFCGAGILTLSSSISSTGYIWSTHESTSTISAAVNGDYYVILKDTNGCLSYPSDTSAVRRLDGNANAFAGNDTTLCLNLGNVQFNGTPSFGTWSGDGITKDGLFDPLKLQGTGTYHIAYSYCMKKDTLTITLNRPPVKNDFYFTLSEHKVCPNGGNSLITGHDFEDASSYVVYLNDVAHVALTPTDPYTYLIAADKPLYVKVITNSYNSCGTFTSTQFDTIRLLPSPKIDLPIQTDTTFYSTKPVIKIFTTQLNYKYVVLSPTLLFKVVSDTTIGNGSTLTIPLLEPVYNPIQILVRVISPDTNECTVYLLQAPTIYVKPVITGINPISVQNEGLQIYPNPSSNQLTVHVNTVIKDVSIRNIMGEEIHATVINRNSDSWTIDLEQLPSGVYSIHVTTGGSHLYSKIMIAK